VTGAAVHWFGQFLGAEEPAKRVAMPFRVSDVTLVPEASVGVEWRASGSLASPGVWTFRRRASEGGAPQPPQDAKRGRFAY
jgi:hypothetical protein